jgi:UDPglucose 6-dehydrogenase
VKIGIVGFGYVGKAMHRFFSGHYELAAFDPYLRELKKIGHVDKIFHKLYTKEDINNCDVAIICVPTPAKEDGSCDISAVEECVSWIESPLIIIKSTVPVRTTDYLKLRYKKNIVFSPEYCGESSYWTPYKFHTDIKQTPFFIFGGSTVHTSQCVDLYLKVTGPTKIYRQTTAVAAEMAKYMENTFYATKILYCYEIAEICKHAGLDFNEVRELWLLDPRINPMHTAVFKDNEKPFSGKCLPKDLSALIAYAKQQGYDPKFLSEVRASNERLTSIIRESKRSQVETE